MSGWGERFREWTENSPPLIVFFFIAVLISSLLTITGAIGQSYRWYSQRFNWREHEYSKLLGLKAGYSLEKFKEQLGSPVFVQSSKDKKLIHNTFKGRDYWVQAVSNDEGTVQQYAVTSCARTFQPTFSFGNGGSSEGSLTLNVSTLASMDTLRELLTAKYYISGATSNSYLFDILSSSNPTQYKTYAWGVNFSCPSYSTRENESTATVDDFLGKEYRGAVAEASDAIQQFREETVINTYVETAPFVDPIYGEGGDLGVDRILIRTD